jgi:hypothetical protein
MSTVLDAYCGHCGKSVSSGSHDACKERLRMEPPRYCTRCKRRMTVQVSPTSWIARCVEHGEILDR